MSSRVRTDFAPAVLLVVLLAHSSAQTPGTRAASAAPLKQAKIELSRHEFGPAEAHIWQVLSSQPNNTEGLFLLALVRAEQQRYAEAQTLFQRVLQLEPNSAEAHLNLGKTYLAENQIPEATEEYQKAEQLAPRSVEVRVTLSRLYAANGEFSSALTTLDGIPAGRLPQEAIPIKAGCLLALGREPDAVKLAQEARNPAVDLAVAEVFVTSNLPQEALKLLSAAETSGQRPPARFYFVKAKALDAESQEQAAILDFQKAIAMEPKSEEFLLGFAEFYARQNNHAQAFAILQKAYPLDPDSPKVLRPLILEASFAGKSADVQEAAAKLAKSDDPKDLFISANVFLTNTRQDEAVPLLEKYLAKVPDDARAWVGLGVGYEDQKRFADAQKAFEKALQVDPKFADAEYQLGVLISLTGNSALAIQHYEHAIELNPKQGDALEKLGNLYLEASQFEKARDVLLKAEAVDPKNRKVEYGLALVYSKLGDREEARIHMERFANAGPIGASPGKTTVPSQ